jgi:predicted DNA-binding protein
MVLKKRRKLKSERLALFIDAELKQHLYNVSEHTGTVASEIVRQAIKTELDTHYSKLKDKTE